MKHSSLLFIILLLISCSEKNNEHSNENSGVHQNTQHNNMKTTHWNAPESETTRTNPVKTDPQSIARGLMLYKKNCAACHGEQAMGDGPAGITLTPKPANLAKMSGKHPDGDFAWKISTGRGAMPPWKAVMSANDIWDIVNYIQSLSSNTDSSGTTNSANHNDVH